MNKARSCRLIMLVVLAMASGHAAQAAGGFKVWSQSVNKPVTAADAAPAASAASLDILGVRNGMFNGLLVVADDKPIKGQKVSVSALTGPAGTIPVTAIQVRYALPDGHVDSAFDSLEEAAPAEAAVAKGVALQPVWIAVSVPADAKPGDYAGQVAIGADGGGSAKLGLNLKVLNWVLPPPASYSSRMDFVVSPETEAMAYNKPLWSDAHLKLLDRTYSLLAPMADRSVYITAIRRTHFGNEHAMVRWVMSDEGDLTPDMTIVEKYLDVVCARIKPLGVILYCWEPVESGGHATSDNAVRLADRQILITVVDPKTGELSAQPGPSWGTPECKQFWKKLSDAMLAVLKKRGLENTLMFGLAGDWRPTQSAMDEICNGVPNARWAGHSHLKFGGDDHKQFGYEMGYCSILWGIGLVPEEPSKGYCFGWSNPFWLTFYCRNEIKQMQDPPLLPFYRLEVERYIGALPKGGHEKMYFGAGATGLGRIGADFWWVVKDATGRPRGNLAGFYPEVSWGQMSMDNCVPWILGRGKNGAVPTVRSEVMREGLQELEARIYLEKAWLDDSARALLGEDLRGRIRALLDERIRTCVALPVKSDSKAERVKGVSAINVGALDKATEAVYALAGETALKYNGKSPKPSLGNLENAAPAASDKKAGAGKKK